MDAIEQERASRRNIVPPRTDSNAPTGEQEERMLEELHFAGAASAGPNNPHVPSSLKEAFSGPDCEKWRAALDEEITSLQQNDVYEVVPIPSGVKPITSKPVMRIKFDRSGDIERYKLRIVARGFVQKEGVDYKEVFAPVANLESIRIILALAAKYNLELDQMDVATAYLNGELEEELYLLPPDGVQIPDGHCWRLKRSLYGLKQAGRTWNKTLDRSLTSLGFTRLDAETCLYVFKDQAGNLCFLVVYVDDLLLAANSRAFMNTIKKRLAEKFKMRDLGAASYILGMEIKRNRSRRTISLSQKRYIETVLGRYGMADCKPVWTPMVANQRVSAEDPHDNRILHNIDINGKKVAYASVVGSLMYAMLGTRPDIAYAVGVLGRYSANPKACHWDMAKRVLRYLKATREMKLTYDGGDVNTDMHFHGFSDADWSGDGDTSRSTSGYVFISNGGAIGWASKRQSIVR